MITSVKSPLLFLISAMLVSAFVACRQAEVAQPERTRPHTEPLPFALGEMSKRYETVNNYTAVYEKEERTISKGAKETINFWFRKPFAVRMEWLNDKGKVDQTAVYQEGKNDGNILTKEGGLVGSLLGTVEIKPDSALAREDSRYPITRAGLGDLIQRIIDEANDPQTDVNFLGEDKTSDGRAVYKVEMSNQPGGVSLSGAAAERRSLVFIDKELFLPIKVEIYDAGGALYERHVYKNLKLNVNLPDKTFEL